MNKTRLLSTVAATLLLTVGAVSAQNVKKDEAPAPAPAAQQSAPAEKMAPALQPGEQKASTKKAPETTGQGTMKSPDPKGDVKGDVKTNTKNDAKTDVKAKESMGANGAASPSAKSANESKKSTTGQGAAAGSGALSGEQRTKITTIIRQHKVAPVKLNVSVRVGTRVPQSVHFNRLPSEVYVIYPQWRGYDYILVGDEILVIDPRTHEIVAILEA